MSRGLFMDSAKWAYQEVSKLEAMASKGTDQPVFVSMRPCTFSWFVYENHKKTRNSRLIVFM